MTSKITKTVIAGLLLSLFSGASQAIYNGVEIERGEWPQAVAICIGKSSSSSSDCTEKCSGVVLSGKTILTAAHCFRAVRASNVKSLHISNGRRGKWQSVRVTEVVLHPNYDPQFAKEPSAQSPILNADMAVIKLYSTLSKNYVPVSGVLDRHQIREALSNDSAFWAVAAGEFGRAKGRKENDYMRKVQVKPTLSGARPFFSARTLGPGKYCHGDSGSGLFVKDKNGRVFLAGIQSAAANITSRSCNATQSIGLYALPTDSMEWIRSSTR